MAYEHGTATDHTDLYAKLRAFLVAGENAAQTLTLTATPADTETVTIDAKVYTFQTALTNVDGNVLIGADMTEALNNLKAAIILEAGAGTTYAAATTAHPTARAVRGAGNTLVARALTPGAGGNSIATTETLANGSWGAATMASGSVQATGVLTLTGNALDTETVTIGGLTYTFQTVLTNVARNVLIGATASDSIDNLVAAITLGAGSGTLYAAATTVHPSVTAAAGTGDTMDVTAKAAGAGGNDLATTETLTDGSFASATLTGGSGSAAWRELSYDSVSMTAIYEAPGLSGTDEIHVGLGLVSSVGTDAYALTGWMFRTYNPSLGHQAQPGHSGLGYQPIWNQPTPYWFISNGQRVIIITKISTVYTSSYLGKILPYGTPSEWPQPYYLGMPFSSNTRWSSVSENFRNFFNPGSHNGSRMLNPSGVWYNVANFTTSSGTEVDHDGVNYIWPFQANLGIDTDATRQRHRELRDNVDDVSYTLWPLILCGENPNFDIWGELDGAYSCPGFDAASEDIIEQDNEQHLLHQDTFHTARYYYCAVKLL